MTGFSWTALTLSLLLFAGNSFAVDQNELAKIVDAIWEKFNARRMFSMAVSIPEKENKPGSYDFNQILTTENGVSVNETIREGNVYMVDRIVAAKFKPGKKGDDIHAEYRVLQNFKDWDDQNNFDHDHDLLLFYVLGSPCYHKCTSETHPQNILRNLSLIKKWKHYAFVFTLISISKNPNMSTTEAQRAEALQNLMIYNLGATPAHP
ncbi:uncharacterized protein si:ch73-288o11.5 isoform X2 [Lates calcarifer]|uniref:Uncharacterized protein si:ch73-288o11.5 isoform X2 n=1 Tax=Lates calcarifer TaxID=8187 RepID=A0AAJ8B0G9_LATCA|nr:uncharacterized protein si:ch73-288o11.5 isoform X2 [Lates calcarifer]